MSDANERLKAARDDGRDASVLAQLPPTRPQRSSPRRAAARGAQAGKPTASRAEKPPASRARKPKASATGARKSPAQGRRAVRAGAAPAAKDSSARPTAGAGASASNGAGKPAGPGRGKIATAGRGSAAGVGGRAGARERRAPNRTPVPRQGYESDADAATGPVQPPGGTELLVSAAEIVGELTKAGFASGERLLRDALSRLPFG